MARKSKFLALTLLLVALLLVGCKSTKSVQGDKRAAVISLAEVEQMQAVQGALPAYSAKMKLTASVGGNTLSSQGTLRLKEGEGVQMGVTPLGLFEAARAEFSPLYVLVINRLKKEYSLVHYSNIALLQQLGLNHTLLQAVLQNRVNLPEGKPVAKSLAAMDITLEGDTLVLATASAGITYKYYIEKSSGLLLKSVGVHKGGTTVTCLYEGFSPVGDKLFPHKITLALTGAAKPVELSFQLGKVKEEYDYTATAVSSSYKKVAVTDLLDALAGK